MTSLPPHHQDDNSAVMTSLPPLHHDDNSAVIASLPPHHQDDNSGEGNKKPSRWGVQVDGGWGWIVLFGSFYVTTFLMNITICFGILFSQKMNTLSASSTSVSIIFSMHSVMWNFGTLLTNSLVNKFGHRSVALCGYFVASVSFMLLAFSSTLTYVFIMYSIILGISGGIGSTVCFLIVPQYFDQRRGLAMAVIMTGIAFGGIVSPMIIRALHDEYGFFGGFLIHGAIVSNCCVAAALFRPPPKNETSATIKIIVGDEEVFLSYTSETITTHPVIKVFTKIKTELTNWIKTKVAVLKQFRALLTGFSLSTHIVGQFNFLMLVPFIVESTGHTPMFSAWCITAFSITNTSIRLIMAIFADRKWFNRRAVFIFGAFLSTLSTFAFVFVSFSEHLMTAAMLSAGLGIGLYMSLFHVNLIDVLGMELYPEVVGVNSAIMAVTFATAGPFFGLLHDLSGSYSWSVYACAALQLCSALLLLPLPFAVSRDKRMLLKRQENASKE